MKLVTVVGGSAGAGPDVPTIGTATGGNAQATVAFTVPAYTGKGGAVVYRAISTPSNIEATASSSPITVTGLSNGTSYTFQVRTETSYGVNSAYSSASNSVTPAVPPVVPPVTPPVDPCAGSSCPTFGAGGVYLGDPINNPGNWTYQYTYQQCIQEICGSLMGFWEAHISNDGCCQYGLFIGCSGNNQCPI